MRTALIALAAVATMATATPTWATEGMTVPAGDSLALTPPGSATRKQLSGSSYRTRAHHLRQGRSAYSRRGVGSEVRMTR